MKNIYLIPTDKPSRLGRFIDTLELILRSSKDIPRGENVSIYITSDEEIKDLDIDTKVYIFKSDNGMITCLAGKGYGRVKTIGKYYEIILTTDPDLIADGVQAIDDEFLQWFVKNPSSEYVEVVHHEVSLLIDDTIYKIIIPQEEPKQETLEEAAENQWGNVHRTGVLGFIEGAKWQQERSYSEEEVKLLLDKVFHMYASEHALDAKEWFENNKKK
jgi:hypothetical protein